MGQDPKPTERRARLGKAERRQAQERIAAKQQPLSPHTISVTHNPPSRDQAYGSKEHFTGAALTELVAAHDDGVLKICPTEDPLVCYSYWRFTRGRWAGHYVCALTSRYELGMALTVLKHSIELVHLGAKKPTRDRYQ